MKQTITPIVIIIGRSGSGKTTLMEKLIRELSSRGYRLAAVKHHSHAGFEVDTSGKDSWRFAQAGSQQVIIAAPDKIATYWKIEHELSLDEVVQEIRGVDLILVEGYRNSHKPSIEVLQVANNFELVGTPEHRIAVVSDAQIEIGVPHFHLNDIKGVADLIEHRFLTSDAN